MYAQLRASLMAILYIILFIVGVINSKDIVNRQAPNAQNLDLMQLLLNDLDLISSDVAELVIRSTSDDKKNPKMMLDVSFSVKVKSRRSFILEEDDEPISSVLRLDDIHEDINKMIKRKLAQAEESIAIPSNHIRTQEHSNENFEKSSNTSQTENQVDSRITFKCCFGGTCEITNIC